MARIAVEETEIAWAAGLFEGEGSIHYRTATGKNSVRITLSLCSTDRDVVDRFANAVGHPHVTTLLRQTEKNKTVYRWQTQATSVVKEVLGLLYPYLGERRSARAREALAARAEYELTKSERYSTAALKRHEDRRKVCVPV